MRRPSTGRREASVARIEMFRRIFEALPGRVRSLMAPRYRPERHYMRGHGPACAARRATQL